MKVWIAGYGEHELNEIRLDWRLQAATLTPAHSYYYHSRRFPGYGPRTVNPKDTCKCAKCAPTRKNT